LKRPVPSTTLLRAYFQETRPFLFGLVQASLLGLVQASPSKRNRDKKETKHEKHVKPVEVLSFGLMLIQPLTGSQTHVILQRNFVNLDLDPLRILATAIVIGDSVVEKMTEIRQAN
jgi:hypothetical protein